MLVIVVFAGVLLRRELGFVPWGLEHGLSGVAVAALTLAPMVAIAGAAQLIVGRAARRLDSGNVRAVATADRAAAAARWATVAWHLVSVFLWGWVDVVTRVTGEAMTIGELVAAVPALVGLTATWWTMFPIERRLREAVMMRALDEGRTIYPLPTRGAFVMMNVRHQLMLIVAPMVALAAWTEASAAGLDWLRRRAERGTGVMGAAARFVNDGGHAALVEKGLKVAGVLAVLAVMPLAISLLWDTAVMEAGPMRERLEKLAGDAGVRVRRLLVWRTKGTMVNGAVIGLVPGMRFILLTDALLDALPQEQVEAVMAHEVAHVRRRHIPWLAGVLITTASMVGLGLDAALGAVPMSEGMEMAAQLAAAGVLLTAAMVVFGWVSRRFEWQADAFAAQTISRSAGAGVVTLEAAAAMAGALNAVARLNHIPPGKHSFRHGSIDRRVRNLAKLVNVRLDEAPVDRVARRIKWACLAGLAVTAVVGVWQGW